MRPRTVLSSCKTFCGIPTDFLAEYGRGEPVIGIMGELDAMSGLSQAAFPERSSIETGAPGPGCGCGQSLFGSASPGRAIAVKQLIEAGDIEGTIRFYGTPAGENFLLIAYLLQPSNPDRVC